MDAQTGSPRTAQRAPERSSSARRAWKPPSQVAGINPAGGDSLCTVYNRKPCRLNVKSESAEQYPPAALGTQPETILERRRGVAVFAKLRRASSPEPW